MHGRRRQHDAAIKAKVALEGIKGEKTLGQIAGEYGNYYIHVYVRELS